jgi:hypothetical protein
VSALQKARAAGHADPSYYFQTARNLAQGRGFTNDFIWQFLVQPASVHHYAGDYWQPLPSFLLALPMMMTGDHSLIMASSASVVASVLAALAAGALAFNLTGRHAVAGMTVMLVALLPRLSYFSVQTESVPFYLLFVMSALALATARRSGGWRWSAAVGACAAAAWLCRNDGLLVVLVLGTAQAGLLFRAWRAGRPAMLPALRRFGGYSGGVLVVLTPWVVANERAMHRPLPPTTQLPFLTRYEQLFQIGRHAGLHDLLQGGVWNAVTFRWHTAKQLYRVIPNSLGRHLTWFLLALAVLNGAVLLRRLLRRRSPGTPAGGAQAGELEVPPVAPLHRVGWPTVLACAASVFLFDAVISPVASLAGAWGRSSAAYLPILLIAALLGASRLPWGRTIGWTALLASIALPQLGAVSAATTAIDQNNAFGQDIRVYADFITQAEAGGHGAVMTREPWETTEITGYPSVQIPDNDLCTAVSTARRYGATVFVTHVTRPAESRRILLKHGFVLIGSVGPSNVMRFPAHVTGC